LPKSKVRDLAIGPALALVIAVAGRSIRSSSTHLSHEKDQKSR
jgi:hypothetical protein